MKIIDDCGLCNKMKRLAIEDTKFEHCAIATMELEKNETFRIKEYCMIEDVGGSSHNFGIKVPAESSYVFIRHCKKEKQIPFIIHTHTINGTWTEGVEFSEQDICFIKEFVRCVKDVSEIPYCLFAVYDNKSSEYCLYNRKESKFTYTKEQDGDKQK